jgi:hypothetical protein
MVKGKRRFPELIGKQDGIKWTAWPGIAIYSENILPDILPSNNVVIYNGWRQDFGSFGSCAPCHTAIIQTILSFSL